MSGICSAHQHHEPGCPQCESLPPSRVGIDERFGVVVQRTYDVVGDGPAFVSRFRWRAKLECGRLERLRLGPGYRYEVVPDVHPRSIGKKRWAVWAFQNIAVPG